MEGLILKNTNCDVCGSGDSTEVLQRQYNSLHQCRRCGLIYSRPMPENLPEANKQHYANLLGGHISKVEKRHRVYRKKLKRFSRYRLTGNFLEIGCSAGAMLNVARQMSWNAMGVDISEPDTEYARHQLGLNVFTGPVEEAGFQDDFFDVIYTNATLEHLSQPLSTLKECRRILRPKGVFYADTVNWDSYTRRLLGQHWKLAAALGHVHLFTPRNVRSLCAYAGLEHLKTWTTGVRVKGNAPGSIFDRGWHWHLLKPILSILTRVTKKGDSIEFIATKA